MRTNSIQKFLLAAVFLAVSASCFAGIAVSITIAPPVLPVYTQPIIPGDGYIWTPGYWAYGPDGYFWVPGTWVLPPRVGFLWTPGYWGFAGGFYGWHAGYWGPHVGFYGGVNYGFGYVGVGFLGGRWEGGHFAYNTAVANVNTTVIHNTYIDRTVINNTTVNRTSFNGPNGIQAQPNMQERAAMNESHVAPTGVQMSHEQAAGADRSQWASVNHGRPGNPAVSHPFTAANRDSPNHAPAGGAPQGSHSPQPQAQVHPQPQAQTHPQPQAQARPQAAKPPAKPAQHPPEEKR